MHRICYCYEAIQVLNDNVMFMHKILHFYMKPFKCLRMTSYKFAKNTNLMAMCDSIYEQQ